MSGPADTCDFLKTLRSGWWQLAELAAITGQDERTTRRWLREMLKQGLVQSRIGERTARGGPNPNLYALSSEWGGPAA